MHDRPTAILFTESGMVALDSPVKLKILELLDNGVSSFDELVEKSMKAKSTISVHLQDLKELKLIEEKNFPKDKRKKYFVLNAIYLAYSQAPLHKQYNLQMNNVSNLNGDSFKEKLFCTLRYGMEAYGINPKPILKKLGFELGVKIGLELISNDCDSMLEELTIFWKKHKLGEMNVKKGKKTEITVTNCYQCGKMPDVGKTLCSLDEGIIEGIFSSKLKRECTVTEIECYGTGHNNCKFIVENKGIE